MNWEAHALSKGVPIPYFLSPQTTDSPNKTCAVTELSCELPIGNL